jgi:hypothetical protein
MAAVALAGATAVTNVLDARRAKASLVVHRLGSRAVTPPVPITHEGTSFGPAYEVTYRVASPGSDTEETWTLRPPFDLHRVIRGRGKVVEVDEQALGVSASQTFTSGAPASQPQPVVISPPPAAPALRPGPVVADAVARGMLVAREQRMVAGRRCQVYRTGTETGGGEFVAPPAQASGDHIDMCVDADGLLLEAFETYRGKTLRQRVATRVNANVTIDDGTFAQLPRERTVSPAKGGGSVRRMDPTSEPLGPFLVASAAPEGFTFEGRYEVIPPQADLTNPATRGSAVAAVSDVWVRGPDMIVLERGARLDKSNPFELSAKFPDVDLGPVAGVGDFVPGTTGADVRSLLGSGRFMHLYGTVNLGTLTSLARSLRETNTGTGPRYLD